MTTKRTVHFHIERTEMLGRLAFTTSDKILERFSTLHPSWFNCPTISPFPSSRFGNFEILVSICLLKPNETGIPSHLCPVPGGSFPPKNLGTYVLDPDIVLLEKILDSQNLGTWFIIKKLGQFAALVELNGRK